MNASRLRILGRAGLYTHDETELLLGPGKSLALLVYLALTPGRRTSRDLMLNLLWADLEPDRARGALRQALFYLRRLLGEHAVLGSEELTLGIELQIDRDDFLKAIERGDLEAAIALYHGEFLPAFAAPGGAEFEHWADLERDRLRAAFFHAAGLLIHRLLNQSRWRDAQKIARRVRDEVPDSEAAWRLMIETVIAGRDFVAAAVEADGLEQWAAAEGILLEPATRALLAKARQITPAASEQEFALVAELTGREREFAAITSAWDSARSGNGRHVHVSAQAGLGKTRLLRDAAARIAASGARIVELRGASGDRDIPYAFAADFALALAVLPGAAGVAPAAASSLIALNPALSSHLAGNADHAVGDDALRQRVHAFADLIQAVAHEQPLVLAIDDVHWLDASSFHVLEGVCARLKQSSVLCLTASRPERSFTHEGITVLEPAPLSEREITSFIAAIGTLPDSAAWVNGFIGGMHAATHGSPLLILETLRLALDENILTLRANQWQCVDETGLLALLREGEALRQRVRSLPPDHGWLLAVLATVERPAGSTALGRALNQEQQHVSDTLLALERNGLVRRNGSEWLPAHDEIAQAARDAAPDRVAEANRAAATLLLSADSDIHARLRALRHLVAAGDRAALHAQFVRYARLARERRDRRSFAELAAEVDASSAESLVRALPPHWHIGLWSAARQRVAAAVLLMLSAATGAAMYARDISEAQQQRLVYVDSANAIGVIAARTREWDGRNTPLAAARGRTALAAAGSGFPDVQPAVSPDGKSVAWNQSSGDSTTIDIWIRTPNGTRRLTHEFRDDLVTGWLPDGSALVGLTNRWSSLERGGYDVAIFDTATGNARPVTRDPAHEGGAFISPDGTRIALIREQVDGPQLLCVTAFDGLSPTECRLPGGYPPAQLVGWSSPVEFVVVLDRGESRPLVRYDWQHDQITPLFGLHASMARMSPDRRWIVSGVRQPGIQGIRDWIIPLDRPAHARRVEEPADGPARVRWWEGAHDDSQLIDRIEFTDTTRSIVPGVGSRLAIRALNRKGTQVPVLAPVRWTSSDTAVATVDSAGTVHPRTTGSVTITASLAGWRSASKRIDILGKPVVSVFDEQWDADWERRWIKFGEPEPIVVAGPQGMNALWSHGDGTYSSVAVLRRAFSARHGLGIEIRLSTPLVPNNGQRARTVLIAGLDTAAFRGANQRKDPPSLGRVDASCAATFPIDDGNYYHSRIGLLGGVVASLDLAERAKSLRSGEWWTLRLQILPDGRCGVAINNQVLWVSTQPIPLDGEFRLWLGDTSVGTKLLHGPLQMWTGVKTDIQW